MHFDRKLLDTSLETLGRAFDLQRVLIVDDVFERQKLTGMIPNQLEFLSPEPPDIEHRTNGFGDFIDNGVGKIE